MLPAKRKSFSVPSLSKSIDDEDDPEVNPYIFTFIPDTDPCIPDTCTALFRSDRPFMTLLTGAKSFLHCKIGTDDGQMGGGILVAGSSFRRKYIIGCAHFVQPPLYSMEDPPTPPAKPSVLHS